MATPWTKDDDKEILRLVAEHGRAWATIGPAMGRTSHSVRIHVERTPKLRLAIEKIVLDKQGATRQVVSAEAAPDPTHAEILRLERAGVSRDAELRTLKAKLAAVHKDESLFERLAGVVREVVQPLPSGSLSDGMGRRQAGERLEAPATALREAGDHTTPCDFVLILSDEHADQTFHAEAVWGIDAFSWPVFCARLERLRDLVRDYATTHLPRHRPERLIILKLGDACHGDINGHRDRNAFQNTMIAALAIGDAEAQFAQSLIPHFPLGVHIIGLSGNHARRTEKKDYDRGPRDSFDFLVGTQMATRLANEIDAGRCSVTLPDSWQAFVRVRELLIAMSHGDEAWAQVGLPFVSFDRRNTRVQSMLSRVGQRADVFVAGHWHTPGAFASAGATSYHSGCFAAADPYAINRLATGGEPQQLLLVVGDKPGARGVLLPIPIYLRDEKREAGLLDGTYVPNLGARSILDSVAPEVHSGLHIVEVG